MEMTTSAPSPARVFVSYAHEDRAWCDQLLRHLGGLRNAGKVETFDDRELEAGEKWEARLHRELDRADVIVLIVTANFLHSRFCTTVELTRALERYREDAARIIPIIADDCDWQALRITQFQALPQDEQQNLKPLREWKDDVSKPLAAIARKIRHLVDRIEVLRKTISLPLDVRATQVALATSGQGSWVHPVPPDRLMRRGHE